MKLNKNKKEIKATRLFTDRTEFREAFWNKYNLMKENINNIDDVYILNYYGLGGIGKSGLIRELEKELTQNENKPYYMFYDFQVGQDVYSILKILRNNLIDKYKFEFPKFDIALICYAKKVGEIIDKEEIKSMVESSRTLSLLLDASEFIPQLSIAASLFKLADSGIAWIRNLTDKSYKIELSKLENMSAEEILKKLPEYFAKDMTNNVNELDKPFVMFLDTYEKLVDVIGNEGKAQIKDLWLRDVDGLILNIPNILWVISGREKLSWSKYDSDWNDSIESHLLGDLSYADADDFLRNAGFLDENLRRELVNLTNGTPVYLDICVSTLETLLQNEEDISIDKFGKNTEQLLERFIRYMDNQSREITHLFCLLNSWTDNMIIDVGTKIIPSFSSIIYDILKDSSFVIKNGESYYVHKTVRDTMNKACPSIIKQKYCKVMYEYLYGYLVKGSNVLNEQYSNYIEMYLEIIKDTLNIDNSSQYIIYSMKIYHAIKSSGNKELAIHFFNKAEDIFNIECKNSYVLIIEKALLLIDSNDVYSSVFLCMNALSNILQNSICDIYGTYKILEIRKNTINFLSRDFIHKLSSYIGALDFSKDILIDENKMIYGKSPEFYMYKAQEIICSIIDYSNNDAMVLFLNTIDRINNTIEKLEITIDFLKKFKDEDFFSNYNKVRDCISFCDNFLDNEQNYSNLLERNVACILADLANIYSTEYFFNKEKALYFISKAEKVSLDYYNNDLEVYVYVMEKKVNILLQIDKKQACTFATKTIDYINENYTKEDTQVLKFSSEFASIANLVLKGTKENSNIDKIEYDKTIKQGRFLVGILNSELDNIYRLFEKMYPEYVKGIEVENFKEFNMLSIRVKETSKDNNDYYNKIIKVYDIIHEYFVNELNLTDQKLLMFLESLIATVDFFGGDTLKYRIEYLEICKKMYGEYEYNTLDGYYMLSNYYLQNNSKDLYLDICIEMMKCCNKIGVSINNFMHIFTESIDNMDAIDSEVYLYEKHINSYKEYFEKNRQQYYTTLERMANLKINSNNKIFVKSGISNKVNILDELKKYMPKNNIKIIREEISIALACSNLEMIEEAVVFSKEAQYSLKSIKEDIEITKYMYFINLILTIYINCDLIKEAKEMATELRVLLEQEKDIESYNEMSENCKKVENM